MGYYNQATLASYTTDDGIVVTIKGGLNTKSRLELSLNVPKHLHSLYNDVAYVYNKVLVDSGTWLYFAENKATGEVSYYAYSGECRGFGGTTFRLQMEDGSVDVLKGAWSSRAECLNMAGFNPCLEVVIRSKYNMASNLTAERVYELVKPLGFYTTFDNNVVSIRRKS